MVKVKATRHQQYKKFRSTVIKSDIGPLHQSQTQSQSTINTHRSKQSHVAILNLKTLLRGYLQRLTVNSHRLSSSRKWPYLVQLPLLHKHRVLVIKTPLWSARKPVCLLKPSQHLLPPPYLSWISSSRLACVRTSWRGSAAREAPGVISPTATTSYVPNLTPCPKPTSSQCSHSAPTASQILTATTKLWCATTGRTSCRVSLAITAHTLMVKKRCVVLMIPLTRCKCRATQLRVWPWWMLSCHSQVHRLHWRYLISCLLSSRWCISSWSGSRMVEWNRKSKWHQSSVIVMK